MARRKRTSKVATAAETRAAALKSIDSALVLNDDLTLAGYNAAIDETKAKLADYNTKLSNLDGELNELQKLEKSLKTLTARMLAGVGVKYGKDSDQYEKAGGTRDTDRKAPTRTATAKPTAA